MYARSDSLTMTVHHESFAFPGMATRSTQPEVFTFERTTAQASAVRSYVPVRPKKRCTRVMYPAKVRMHLPPPEKSQAKRWLVILCLVVLWQIYTEEPCADAPLGGADGSVADYQGFPFQSAEEEAAQLARLGDGAGLLPAAQSGCEDTGASGDRNVVPNATYSGPGQDAESSRSFEQSAGKGYMVALLVYHRLGCDN